MEGGVTQMQACNVSLDFSLMEACVEWSQCVVLVACYALMVRNAEANQYRDTHSMCCVMHSWVALEASGSGSLR